MGSEETGMPRQWDLKSDKLWLSPMKCVWLFHLMDTELENA